MNRAGKRKSMTKAEMFKAMKEMQKTQGQLRLKHRSKRTMNYERRSRPNEV